MTSDEHQLFVFPAASDEAKSNLENSVYSPIDSDREDINHYQADEGGLYAWGATRGKESTWDKMNTGDYVLIYRDKKYKYCSNITGIINDKELAEEIWSDEDFEFIFFLQKPRRIDVPFEEEGVLDYETIPGLMRVRTEKVDYVRKKCGSVQRYVEDILDNWEETSGEFKSSNSKGKESSGNVKDRHINGQKSNSDTPRYVRRIKNLLLEGEKNQIIFAGPPGTSKTYDAFQVISDLKETDSPESNPIKTIEDAKFSGDPEEEPNGDVVWDIVQFHQSYGYEDFVSGIEAKTEKGQQGLSFEREKRIFLQLVEAAQKNEETDYVLIIDEINRGALGRVFGELILTLEYRDLPVRLPGQDPEKDDPIKVPENLYLIGTMNTADRNISLVDHALRRRFHFVRREPEKHRLEDYLEGQDMNQDDKELIKNAYDAIQSAFKEESDGGGSNEYAESARGLSLRDYAVGHTYFMVEGREALWRNLRHQVLPLLEEYHKEGILDTSDLGKAARKLHIDESASGDLHDWCERYQDK